ncbi:hypothetical protein [Floridanema aerugineum]|uniref:Uncharacterized protein n=1 Tax=Floridaenema aerugineum BLCC-F46 TaxID=3153654 RepID=A0ABV4XDT0_9CYAN
MLKVMMSHSNDPDSELAIAVFRFKVNSVWLVLSGAIFGFLFQFLKG